MVPSERGVRHCSMGDISANDEAVTQVTASRSQAGPWALLRLLPLRGNRDNTPLIRFHRSPPAMSIFGGAEHVMSTGGTYLAASAGSSINFQQITQVRTASGDGK